MWRHVGSNAFSLLIVLLFVTGGLISWGNARFAADGPLAEATFFEVRRGASLKRVSEDLAEAGIISSPSLFRIGAQYSDRAGNLKFGNYEIPAGASMTAILDILTKGGVSTFRYVATYVIGAESSELRLAERNPSDGSSAIVARFASGDEVPTIYSDLVAEKTPMAIRIVLPEGLTSWQVSEGLKAADFLEGEIESVPAEGNLAPDSYEVTRGATRESVLERMEIRQMAILDEVWAQRAGGLPLNSPQEALILASIIEKETGVGSERGLVSSVFINRLNRGMRLQTDPTVIYGITLGKGSLGRGLRVSELRGKTPYNTYQIDGLPPTPIANPGRASIEAALNPEDSEFIFFVADGTGGHAFATNLNDHNANVAKWRKIERENNNN